MLREHNHSAFSLHYELAFLIELVDLKGREKLHNNEVYSILKY